jgi:hypothetical protein
MRRNRGSRDMAPSPDTASDINGTGSLVYPWKTACFLQESYQARPSEGSLLYIHPRLVFPGFLRGVRICSVSFGSRNKSKRLSTSTTYRIPYLLFDFRFQLIFARSGPQCCTSDLHDCYPHYPRHARDHLRQSSMLRSDVGELIAFTLMPLWARRSRTSTLRS